MVRDFTTFFSIRVSNACGTYHFSSKTIGSARLDGALELGTSVDNFFSFKYLIGQRILDDVKTVLSAPSPKAVDSAWTRLYRVIERLSTKAHRLARRSEDAETVNDLCSDIYLHLRVQNNRRLKDLHSKVRPEAAETYLWKIVEQKLRDIRKRKTGPTTSFLDHDVPIAEPPPPPNDPYLEDLFERFENQLDDRDCFVFRLRCLGLSINQIRLATGCEESRQSLSKRIKRLVDELIRLWDLENDF